METKTLLNGVTSTTTSAALQTSGNGKRLSFLAALTGSGAVAATATLQGSHDGTTWVDVATINLSGTDSDNDGLTEEWSWAFARVSLTALSGTDAEFTVTMGA